ncbi:MULTISPECIES: signal peptidase I [Clostridium]|uniref:Signal peptidase I n=1 Tax=Clostridium frigoriphilum TaxID=443253 RepID=A0ABU7UKB9_9CLOT|nr:signal peptidase I [Clostridium sp. DSM 17811]MBU3097923.1 signal peptidase I [Clostridium sp. DSM 17811]
MNLAKKIFQDWILPILAAVIIAFIINKVIFFNVTVPTGSMLPTINLNDKILVTRVHNRNNLKLGDIVVFHSYELGEDLIKRLIGLPNDLVEVKEDGSVYINNKKIDQSYVKYPGGKTGKYKVPADSYFFMGDNRINSLDARYWDKPYIPGKDIMGKARIRISPFSKFGKLK